MLENLFRALRWFSPNRLLEDLIEFLHVGVREFLSQSLVVGALFCAWNVIFAGSCAGLSLSRSHLDTLAHRGPRGYLLHVAIKSANAFGFFRLLKRHANSFTYSGRYSLLTLW
jgi:hypothetical protein